MPEGLVRSGDFRNGTPIVLPHQFGNSVAGPNEPFGNTESQSNPRMAGNPVDWTPSPAHFGNQVSFLLQTVPPVVVIAPGATGTINLNLTNLFGSNSATATYFGEPSGVSLAFAPNPDTSTSVVTVTVGAGVADGKYTITIVGTVVSPNIEYVQLHLVVASAGAGGAPTFSFMSPDSGPTAGGTAVTIFGTGFISGTTVSIGGTPATAVVVVSPTELTAVTPAGSQGLTDVKIVNSNGQIDTANAWLYANGGSATITITSAQMKTLNASPITAVAGIPGAVPIVEAGFLVYNPGSTQYTVDPDSTMILYVGQIRSAGNPPLANYTGFQAAGFVDSGSFAPDKTMSYWNPSYQSETAASPAMADIPASDLVGSGIYFSQYTSTLAWPSATEWTLGNGTLTLFVEYSYVKG